MNYGPIAENYVPSNRTADYSQAMMDLGATLCTRSKANCAACPLSRYCCAYQQDQVSFIPQKKISKKIPERSATFIILNAQGRILLIKRPSSGIWGGLWSFPELMGVPEKNSVSKYCYQHFKISISEYEILAPFRHTFSHYHLHVHPIMISIKRKLPLKVTDVNEDRIWYNPQQPPMIGLPKPVEKMMKDLKCRV